jgi:hypothetical protein
MFYINFNLVVLFVLVVSHVSVLFVCGVPPDTLFDWRVLSIQWHTQEILAFVGLILWVCSQRFLAHPVYVHSGCCTSQGFRPFRHGFQRMRFSGVCVRPRELALCCTQPDLVFAAQPNACIVT